jgi:hypothetical protein
MSSCHETKPHVAHAFVVPGSAGSLSTSAGGGSSEPSDGMAVTMQPRVFYLYLFHSICNRNYVHMSI